MNVRSTLLGTCAALVVALSPTASPGIAASAHADPAPCESGALSTSSDPVGGQSATRRPTVFVHGWTDNGNVRAGTPGLKPLADRLISRLGSEIQPYFFDYGAHSTTWASRPPVAGCLGTYITEVSDAFKRAGGDGKVLVVAHSMGGLATLYATDARYTTDPVGTRLAGVVTFGTPYLGSPWGNTDTANLIEQTKAVKAPPSNSDAGHCLGSRTAHGQLPSGCGDVPPLLPAGVPIQQIAGSLTVHRSLFGIPLYDLPLQSDTVVGLNSAQSYTDTAPAGTSTKGQHAGFDTDGCTVDYSAVEDKMKIRAFQPSLAGVTMEALLEWAQLANDNSALDGANGRSLTPGAVVYDAAAALLAPCSHANIVRDQSAIEQAIRALKSDLAANPFTVRATDNAFGQIHLGMTAAQAASAVGAPDPGAGTGFGCQSVEYSTPGGKAEALIHHTEAVVTQIRTPPGTQTDRGVGDGSTVQQITAAYSADHAVRTIETQAGPAIYVTTENPDAVLIHSSGNLIGFPINGNTVGTPLVGGIAGFEYCSG